MVKKLVLNDKIYNVTSKERRKNIFLRYSKYLNVKKQGFSNTTVKIRKLRSFDSRFEVEIFGPEELFIYNLLKKEFGTIYQFDQVSIGNIYKGLMVDVGTVGFGIFVDCGILNPKVDVLINLHVFREQLCDDKEKSLKEIIKAFDFINNFPLIIEITHIDREKKQIQGKIDNRVIKYAAKITLRYSDNKESKGKVVYGKEIHHLNKVLIVDKEKEDILKKYIRHAKRTCFPTLSEEAKEEIKEFYLELRGESDNEEAIVSILARNLDALVRMSEAYAKMALRDTVTKQDVEEIIKLFKRFLQDTGYDTETGKIDMDRILVGQSRSSISKLDKMLGRLKEIFEDNNWKALERKNVVQVLELEEDLDEKWIKDALDELIKEGTLYEPRNNMIKFTNKDD